ncbi:MAG: DUF4422 domain-containing protein [Oscillospiraceae bacterium]
MADIRIFMCCHKGFRTLPPLCVPIRCGSALNPAGEGEIPDCCGENISDKNREYCELTAHYYAWKNVSADYYGFCHYRRFLGLGGTKRPYAARGVLSEKECAEFFGTEEQWRELIEAHELVVPRSEDMGLSVREHYCTSAFHYEEDLAIFLEGIEHRAPVLAEFAQEYLSQNRQYFCNMFIMDRAHFLEYCEMLFAVLEYFDERKTLHGDFQSDRADGYLGELFTGIYINYCRRSGADIAELPRIDAECSWKKRLGCALLPPESKRRFAVKRVVKKNRSR